MNDRKTIHPEENGGAGEDVSSQDLLTRGEKMRRIVLGDDHVNKSMGNAHPYTTPMQEMITKYCWGDIWNRPGLENKTRSLINIGMLTGLCQTHELSVHVKGAINNGCTSDEIREVILQATIYCGAPAGLAAMRVVQQTLESLGKI